MPRYINPATDFGFKHIFKDEEITRGFLNALVKTQNPEIEIVKVSITDGEADDMSSGIRRVVYDVHCTTDKGEVFVIEMQNDPQTFFSERIVYYLSRAASQLQNKGYISHIDENGKEQKEPWNYHMKSIFGVFFMNFKDANHAKKLSHFAFMETTDNYIDSRVIQYWKIQMPLYRGIEESTCDGIIDKWMFNLSNLSTMERELPFTEEIPLFMRLEKIASYSALTPKQQVQYDDSFNNYLAYMGQQEYKLNEGIKIGEAKGRAEGRAEGEKTKAIAMARLMKSNNEPMDKIAMYTGLTIDEIANL